MSRQIELGIDLWWDWHRIQVLLKAATSSVREAGSPFLSQVLVYVGMRGCSGEVLMASRNSRTGQKTTLGRGVWKLRLAASYAQHSCVSDIWLKHRLPGLPGEARDIPWVATMQQKKVWGKSPHSPEFLPLPLLSEQLWANTSIRWSLISGPQGCSPD